MKYETYYLLQELPNILLIEPCSVQFGGDCDRLMMSAQIDTFKKKYECLVFIFTYWKKILLRLHQLYKYLLTLEHDYFFEIYVYFFLN